MIADGQQIYRAEVLADGPVNGRMVRVSLGVCETPSPLSALQWLYGQALRVANGLDLDPRTPWLAGRTLHAVSESLADAPTELRQWCADAHQQREALRQLEEGASVAMTVADHTGRYYLTAWPTGAFAAAPSSRLRRFRKRRPLVALAARLAG
ncbi:hypothetical protein ACZ90_10075 [Streptomyces albus subsp. albus]|nr:hypothetical protein ACZ90_10075 [Streptomyces albus subsp. albus]